MSNNESQGTTYQAPTEADLDALGEVLQVLLALQEKEKQGK